MRYPAPAPVTVLRPSCNGGLEIAEVITNPVFVSRSNGFEADVVTHRYQLIAIQETGEEMSAGFASTRKQALDMKYSWLEAHPSI